MPLLPVGPTKKARDSESPEASLPRRPPSPASTWFHCRGSHGRNQPWPKERLASPRFCPDTPDVTEPAWERSDVNAILDVLFDIRGLLTRLVGFFEDGDEGEEEADS